MIYRCIKITGYISYIFLVVTFIYGISGINFFVHKILGITTIFFASLHLFFNIIKILKIRRVNR
jgi:hypothetical protein